MYIYIGWIADLTEHSGCNVGRSHRHELTLAQCVCVHSEHQFFDLHTVLYQEMLFSFNEYIPPRLSNWCQIGRWEN